MSEHEKINPSMPLRWSDLIGAIPPEPGPAPDVTTEDVREQYMSGIESNVWGLGSHTLGDYEAAFDRWLAALVASAGAIGVRAAAAGVAQLDMLAFDRPHEYADWLNDLADYMDIEAVTAADRHARTHRKDQPND